MSTTHPQYYDPSTGIRCHLPGPGRIPCNDDEATPHQVPLTPRTDRRRAGREPGSASSEYNGPDKLAHKCTGDGKHTTQCRNVGCPNHVFNNLKLDRVSSKTKAEKDRQAAEEAKAAVARAEADLRRKDAISAELKAEFEMPGAHRANVLQENGALTPGVAQFAASIKLPQ